MVEHRLTHSKPAGEGCLAGGSPLHGERMTVAKNDAEEGVETNSSRTVLLDWIKCRSARGCRWATRCRVFRSG
ncbi:hypothetical protein HMPREF3150_00290 [Pseudomonas aeruginosa]|nr:hypothetical protein HMPREF3150_00290 [Pseudomonas aeruginosa]